MKSEIIAIVSDFLEIAPEDLQDYKTLEDLNIDSVDFMEIMFEIEEKFDAPVISGMLAHKEQIHDLGDMLRFIEALILKHREKAVRAEADG